MLRSADLPSEDAPPPMNAPSPLLQTLRSLAETGREGTLTVRSAGGGHVDLYVGNGGLRLVASGNRRGVRIGEVLLKAGKISQRQLDLVLERQQKSNLRFGELLYLMCQITEDEIRQSIRTRIQEEILDLFLLDRAECSFKEGPPPQSLFDEHGPMDDHPLSIPPIIEEGMRRMSEWEAFGRRVPPPDQALSKAPPSPGKSELPLDDRTLQIVELCDGRRGVEQVVEVSPKFRFETLKAISYLVSVGRIQPGGRVVAVATPTEMLNRDQLGLGPDALAVAAPGDAPEAAPPPPTPKPATRGAVPSPTRFGLDSVPDVDWEEEKKASRAPVAAEKRPGTSGAKPAAAFADGPTFEPKPDPNPALPPGYLKKEETSRLMARNAAQAIAHRPPPLPPPTIQRRSRARWGWLVAGFLFVVLAGAGVWEGLARARFGVVDATARGSKPAEARQLYEQFARDWPWSSPAQVALRAAEDLAGKKALVDEAALLRKFADEQLAAFGVLTLDQEESAVAAIVAWAKENKEAELLAVSTAHALRIKTYRAEARVLLEQYGKSVKDGKVADARAAATELRSKYARAPQAPVAVRIETSPPGATIEAGGVKAGLSPCIVEVAPGSALAVAASLEGHAATTLVFAAPLPETVTLLLPRSARWNARASGALRIPATVAPAGVYVVPADGTLLALSPGDGHTLWRARAATHPWITAPVAARGAVLAGDQNGVVWALDAAEGTVLWREPAGKGLRGGIAASGDGAVVFAAPEEGGIAALDTATGSSLGRAELSGTVALGPFALGDTGWVAVLADGSAVAGTAGRVGWSAVLSAPCAAAAVSPAGLLCASTDGAIALVGPDGAIRWTVKGAGGTSGGVAATAKLGVALLSKRRIACYDLASGAVLWTTDLPADASAPPSLGDALALVPCEDGLVRALAVKDGAVSWSFRAGQAVHVRVTPGPGGAVVAAENGDVWFVP